MVRPTLYNQFIGQFNHNHHNLTSFWGLPHGTIQIQCAKEDMRRHTDLHKLTDLLLRVFELLNYHSEMSQYFDESFFEMMLWPMYHEQLELAFLGIIIGALMMNSSHNQEQPLTTTSPIFQ